MGLSRGVKPAPDAGHRALRELAVETPPDDLAHHADGPQGELELILERVAVAHDAHQFADEVRRDLRSRAGDKLRLERIAPAVV